MQTIFKYVLAITDRQRIELPSNSQILSVQMQGNDLCLWALVDPTSSLAKQVIAIYGTGNPVPPMSAAGRVFLATVQDPRGLVWHVFAELP